MVTPTRDIRSIIQHLFTEFVSTDTYSEALFHNYLQIFYANIIRSTEKTYQYYAGQKNNSVKTLMPTILEYINRHYKTLTLETLAAHFNYDTAYLSRIIHKTTGKKYIQMINELKIKEAIHLLNNASNSIDEIAAITGYDSADHFSRVFKQYMGLSPSKYRKSQTIAP